MNLIEIKNELDKSWANTTRWENTQFELKSEQLIGKYIVYLEETQSDIAPHKLILHATDAYTIATYQCMVHSLYAAKNNLFKNNFFEANAFFPEIRRKILTVKTEAVFKKAIFGNNIILESHITDIVNKGALIFYAIQVDINNGSHFIKTTLCINFRDELI